MRGEKCIAPTAAVLGAALALGATACGGKSEPLCPGQRLGSPDYPGVMGADPNDQSTWRTGVLIETVVPPAAHDVVAEYKSPDSPVWIESKPIDPADAGHIGLKIGHGAVIFAIRIEAPADSADCDTPPQTKFVGPMPWDEVTAQDVTIPKWPDQH